MYQATIFTEDTGSECVQDVLNIVSEAYEGFTVTKGLGYWRGVPEASLIITILTDTNEADKVRSLSECIRVANRQESVLFTVQAITCEFVSSDVEAVKA